jgi:hypothetical protein
VLLVARDRGGEAIRSIGASIALSRALPGHRIYRLERLSGGPSSGVDRRLLAGLAEAARRDPLCLRVIVELFDRDSDARASLRRALADLGFEKSAAPRMYPRTLAVDLRPNEADLFSGLHGTARRGIRAPGKRGLEVRPIADPDLAPRLETLVQSTFERNNATALAVSWRQIVNFSLDNPSISRLVGVFDPRHTGPESLLAFAWGCAHGSYASYEAGGREQHPEFGNTPLGYAPLWDLMAWARRETGATWFDLGGVRDDGDDSADGISDFKRYFSREVVDVGEEWTLEPSRTRAVAARVIAATARWAANLRRGALRSSLPLTILSVQLADSAACLAGGPIVPPS